MVMRICVKLIGHHPMLHWVEDRHDVLIWVLDHAEEIESLEIECNINIWTWTAEEGWIQFPMMYYVPGKGMVRRKNLAPKRHGNGYLAHNPWSFSELPLPFPNPLCAMQPLFF